LRDARPRGVLRRLRSGRGERRLVVTELRAIDGGFVEGEVVQIVTGSSIGRWTRIGIKATLSPWRVELRRDGAALGDVALTAPPSLASPKLMIGQSYAPGPAPRITVNIDDVLATLR
jgi:hypothetical protein